MDQARLSETHTTFDYSCPCKMELSGFLDYSFIDRDMFNKICLPYKDPYEFRFTFYFHFKLRIIFLKICK